MSGDFELAIGDGRGSPRLGRGLLLAVLLIAVLPGAGHARPQAGSAVQVAELHYLMATPVLLVARGGEEGRLRAAVRAGFAEVRRLEEILSTFESRSDVSRVNSGAGGPPIVVRRELFDLLREAERLSVETRGAFSVRVGPMVELWKRAAQDGVVPDASALSETRRLVRQGLRLIEPDQVRLEDPGMRVDLAGIAKGFAADRVLGGLRRAGATAGLINFGGSSIAAFGDAGDGLPGWPVEPPSLETAAGTREPGTIRLRQSALSTSAAFGRVTEVQGRRFGHVIDPRTGWPLDAEAVAMVRHRSATVAEALSKALLIDGPQAEPIAARAGAHGLLLRPGAPPLCSPGFRAEIALCTNGSPGGEDAGR